MHSQQQEKGANILEKYQKEYLTQELDCKLTFAQISFPVTSRFPF
jgi:hypothetical protein